MGGSWFPSPPSPCLCPARYQTAGRPPTCDVMRPPRRARSPGRAGAGGTPRAGVSAWSSRPLTLTGGLTSLPLSPPGSSGGMTAPRRSRPGGPARRFMPGRGAPGLPGRAGVYGAPPGAPLHEREAIQTTNATSGEQRFFLVLNIEGYL